MSRGELSEDLDLDLAADLIVGPIATRFFFTGARVNPRIVGPIVQLALHGVLRERAGSAG